MTLDPQRYEALTFDCYGTLIDWERGILEALHDVLGVSLPLEDDSLLERYALVESKIQAGAFRSYREILLDVCRALGTELGVPVPEAGARRFAASVAGWPPFPDSAEALTALSGAYRLAIVSNVDDDLFAGSAAQLGVPFDEVVTAQQVRSYKPAPAHFHEARARLGLPVEHILHVAQSLFHDIAPAKALGYTTVWVNRRAGKEGGGATARARATPDFEVPSLAALVELLGLD